MSNSNYMMSMITFLATKIKKNNVERTKKLQ